MRAIARPKRGTGVALFGDFLSPPDRSKNISRGTKNLLTARSVYSIHKITIEFPRSPRPHHSSPAHHLRPLTCNDPVSISTSKSRKFSNKTHFPLPTRDTHSILPKRSNLARHRFYPPSFPSLPYVQI